MAKITCVIFSIVIGTGIILCRDQKQTCVIVNDDQQDATILAYLFISNQLYMFRAMSSPIIRCT